MKKGLEVNKIILFSFVISALSLFIFDLETIPFGGLTYSTCKWDCYWYRDIILHGYTPQTYLSLAHIGKAAWPFFPLFPALTAGVKALTGLTAEGAALLVNQTLFFFMVALSALYYRKFICNQKTYVFIIALCLSPFSLWSKIQYTECIYGIITVLTFYFARDRKYIPLIICSFLAALTRPTGVLLVSTCSAYLMLDALKTRNLNAFLNGAWPIAVGSLGLSLYMLYLYYLTGDALAFSHMQSSWGRHFMFPGGWIIEAITHGHRINGVISAIIDMFFLYYGFKNRMYLETSLLALTFFVALSSGVESLHRYIMGNPLFVMIFCRMFDHKEKKFTNSALVCLFILNLIISGMWFHDSNYFY
ncbi:hypothetical protein [Komagataeibacter xylinus]|uniref:Glycosyltransferase RgtA/B/C/D-like domain-containing protein n=1 Tax=Komagataeibacter xylinus TaxID=28448 RepID=A0A857FMY6_KOMXY|nr:hypothetical protein [Komagataeibacter xylinus]QHC34859.1 hypothetical protein FMA36_04500 [Komagataeibacter xylinus]